MSLDFYDSNGRPYAYTDDGVHLFSFTGIPIGYVSADSIYSYSGVHIGYFNDGVIRDDRGDTLLFTNESTAGPMKPMKQMKPMKGMKQMKPMKGMKQMKPMRPMKTQGWSGYEPEHIFES
ncbi:4-fold beta flower protein [Vibrio sp. MA40-2]|uniref:4-fold beta flower protein n=1 Tax=Vibrio sp. MA40-2 TaxID=3391828 RepID=UPI0039A69303